MNGYALTWEHLTEIEPRLLALEAEARAYRAQRGAFCANAVWYGYEPGSVGLKRRLSDLVGWERRDQTKRGSRLTSPDAYDVAYHHLYNLLPGCRHQGLLCGSRLTAA